MKLDKKIQNSGLQFSRRKLIMNLTGLAGSGALGLGLSRIALGTQVAAPTAPLRLICYSFPNGCQPELWNFENALSPLLAFRNQVHVFRGLKNTIVEKNGGDGHEQGGASLFTGGVSNDGLTVTGPSLDSVVGRFANSTIIKNPFVAGVTLGEGGGVARSLSWLRRSWGFDGKPNPFETNPIVILQNLFGTETSQSGQKLIETSILKSVAKEYKELIGKPELLSQQAKMSLQAQLDRLQAAEAEINELAQRKSQKGKCPVRNQEFLELEYEFELKHAIYGRVFSRQRDLLISAFQCDFVRTGSLMFGNSGDNYFHENWSSGDHDTSHYFSESTEALYKAYRKLHMENLSALLKELAATPDFDGGSLLDNTVIIAGSEFGDGRAHIVSPQPMLVAGGKNHLLAGKEWDFEMKTTPSQIYATLERLFRKAYSQTLGSESAHFTEEPVSGLAKS